jgi:hypothetical protein
MTQENNGNFNVFDPTGMLKTIRDANVETWSKMMIELVNTDAYARVTGEMLDAWLSNSAPFRKAIEAAMSRALGNLNMPSRAEIISLAERLTNIETRLDDMEAKLDESLRALAATHRKTSPASRRDRNDHN